MVYTVTVNADALRATLVNVATPGPGGECPTPADCTTTHPTPQVAEVTLTKTWVDGYAGDTALLRITGGLVSPAEATSTSNGDVGSWTDDDAANVARTNALAGATIVLGEVLGADNVGRYGSTLNLVCRTGEGGRGNRGCHVPDAWGGCPLRHHQRAGG